MCPYKTKLCVLPLCAWARPQSTYAQLSPLYHLLFNLYVTHVMNYSRPSDFTNDREQGGAWKWGYAK